MGKTAQASVLNIKKHVDTHPKEFVAAVVRLFFASFVRSWYRALSSLMLKAQKWEKSPEETKGKFKL